MSKRNLDEAQKNYLNDSTEGNAIRYAVQLIESQANEEALELLEKVVSDEKIDIANLYKAIAYRNLKDEGKFFEYIYKINNGTLSSEAYYELANFYYLKMVGLKKDIKYKTKEKTKELSLEIGKLLDNVRMNLNESMAIEITGLNLFLSGNVEYYENDYEKAKEYYLEIINNPHLKLRLRDLYFVKMRLAEIYLLQKKYDEALNYTTDLICSQRCNKNAYILHAKIFLKKGNIKKAYIYYKKALERFKDISEKEFFEYAKICANLLNEEEAIKYFDKCKGSYYEKMAFQEEAKMNISLGNFSKAIELYKLLLNGGEKDKNIAYIGIGVALRKKRSFDEAREWLYKALNGTEKDFCLASIELAKIAEEEEKYSESEKYLLECIQKSQGKYGKLELAKLKIKKDAFKEAKEILFEIINNSANEFDRQEAILALASIERFCFNIESALNYVIPFLEYDNAIYYKALCMIIDCYLYINDLDKAQEYLEKLETSKNKIDKEQVCFYRGEIARFKGEFEKAEEYYLKIKDTSYTKEQILFNIANMNLTINEAKFLEIVDELKLISKRGINMSNHLMAMYWIEKQNFKEASKYLLKNIETNNNFNSISIIILAKHEEFYGNYAVAIKYYEEALEKEKYALQALFKLGKIYLKFGDYETSKKYFSELIKKESKYAKNLGKISLAVIDSHLKNYEAADKVFLSFIGTKEETYAKFELAKSKIRQEKHEEALEIFKELEKSSSRKYVLLETARIKNRLGLHKEALFYLDTLYNEGDYNDKRLSLEEKARAYYEMKKYEEARKLYLKLLEAQNAFKISAEGININENLNYINNLSPRDDLLIELSRVERKLGNIEDALNHLFMITGEREKIYAVSELIDIETERKNYDKALEYASLIENSFLKDTIKIKKTTIYLNTGNYEMVHKICETLNDAESINVGTYRNAIAYYCEENFLKAKKLFESLLEQDGEFKRLATLYLGKISVIEKDYEKAKIYFWQQDKSDEHAKLRQLLLIDIHEEKYGDALKKALELYNASDNFGEKENISFILNFLSYNLNVILPKKYYGTSSIYKDNIFSYDKDQIYTHIYNQIIKKNEFNKQVDILLLLDLLEQGLGNENFIRNNIYDEYAIPVDNIGKEGENYLKVLTIPNSMNIISIYPSATKHELFDKYIRKKTRN